MTLPRIEWNQVQPHFHPISNSSWSKSFYSLFIASVGAVGTVFSLRFFSNRVISFAPAVLGLAGAIAARRLFPTQVGSKEWALAERKRLEQERFTTFHEFYAKNKQLIEQGVVTREEVHALLPNINFSEQAGNDPDCIKAFITLLLEDERKIVKKQLLSDFTKDISDEVAGLLQIPADRLKQHKSEKSAREEAEKRPALREKRLADVTKEISEEEAKVLEIPADKQKEHNNKVQELRTKMANEAAVNSSNLEEFDRNCGSPGLVTDPCARMALFSLCLEYWRKGKDTSHWSFSSKLGKEFLHAYLLAELEMIDQDLWTSASEGTNWRKLVDHLDFVDPAKKETIKGKLISLILRYVGYHRLKSEDFKDVLNKLGRTLEGIKSFYQHECMRLPFLGKEGFRATYGDSLVLEPDLLLPAHLEKIKQELLQEAKKISLLDDWTLLQKIGILKEVMQARWADATFAKIWAYRGFHRDAQEIGDFVRAHKEGLINFRQKILDELSQTSVLDFPGYEKLLDLLGPDDKGSDGKTLRERAEDDFIKAGGFGFYSYTGQKNVRCLFELGYLSLSRPKVQEDLKKRLQKKRESAEDVKSSVNMVATLLPPQANAAIEQAKQALDSTEQRKKEQEAAILKNYPYSAASATSRSAQAEGALAQAKAQVENLKNAESTLQRTIYLNQDKLRAAKKTLIRTQVTKSTLQKTLQDLQLPNYKENPVNLTVQQSLTKRVEQLTHEENRLRESMDKLAASLQEDTSKERSLLEQLQQAKLEAQQKELDLKNAQSQSDPISTRRSEEYKRINQDYTKALTEITEKLIRDLIGEESAGEKAAASSGPAAK